MEQKVMGSLEWTLLVLLSVLWGGSFFFSKVALGALPPFTVVLGRVCFTAIALHLMVLGSGRHMPMSLGLWGRFAVMGVLNNVIPFSLIVWSQTQITSGLASILNATTPLWTVLLAHVLTRDERMTANRLGGVVAGWLGVMVMIGPDALAGSGFDTLAQAAVLGAGVSYAFAGIYGRRFRQHPPLITATGQVTCSAVLMVPIAAVADYFWTLPFPGWSVFGAIVGLAVFSTALAYIIYFRLLSTAGATNLLLVTFLIPVSAIVLGVVVLGEHIEMREIVGMACIGLGLALIDKRPLRWLHPAFR